MKRVVVCKRVCFHNMQSGKITHILSDLYNKDLSDYTILCCVFNPNRMERDDFDQIWIKNTWIRVEVYNEYKEVEQWFDKLKRILRI